MAHAGSLSGRSPIGRAQAVLCLTLLAAFCVWARTAPARDIVLADPQQTQLLGTDAHFHLRHTTYAAGNGLQLLRQDCGSGFPRGPANDAAGLWDLGLAAATLLRFGPAPTLQEVARIMVWAPPLLAALTLLLLYRVCRCCLPRLTSLAACGLFALYPGESLERTLLGFADHHAAELLLATALILGLLLQTRRFEPVPSWRRSLLHAAPLIGLAFTWRGAPLYVAAAILAAVLAFGVVAARSGRVARSLALALWRYGAAAFVSAAAVGLLFPSLVLERRSFAIFIAATAGLALISKLASTVLTGFPRRTAVRLGLALATAALGAGVAILALRLGGLAASVLQARSPLVSEHAPVTFDRLVHLTGAGGLLALPGLLVAGLQSWYRRISPSAVLLTAYGVLLLGLWAATSDFGYITAPFLAVNAALTLGAICHRVSRLPVPFASRLPAGLKTDIAPRTLAAGVLLILAIAPLWPLEAARPPVATNAGVSALRIYTPAWLAAMSWLAEHSPAPARSPRCCKTGEHTGSKTATDYAVMTPWTYGDAVATHAGRIPRWSRQPSAPVAAWGLATTEAEAMDALCPDCAPGQAVRYAVLGASTCGHRFLAEAAVGRPPLEAVSEGRLDLAGGSVPRLTLGPGYRDSMFFRLCSDRGNGLSQHRLVYESPRRALTVSRLRPSGLPDPEAGLVLDLLTTDPGRNPVLTRRLLGGRPERTPLGILYDARLDPEVSIYEVVRGATIVGRAPARSSVAASLDLVAPNGDGRWTYEVRAQAGEDGAFSLTVAYPTTAEPERSTVFSDGPYTLRAVGPYGPVTAELEVDAEQVRDGAVLDAPELPVPGLAVPRLEAPPAGETAGSPARHEPHRAAF